MDEANLHDALTKKLPMTPQEWDEKRKNVQALLDNGEDPTKVHRSKNEFLALFGFGLFAWSFAGAFIWLATLAGVAGAVIMGITAAVLIAIPFVTACYNQRVRPRPIHEAAELGDPEIMRMVAQKVPSIEQVIPDSGKRALHFAANAEVARVLVNEFGADINAKAKNGWSALDAALFYGRSSTAQWLLQQGAAPTKHTAALIKEHNKDVEKNKITARFAYKVRPGKAVAVAPDQSDSSSSSLSSYHSYSSSSVAKQRKPASEKPKAMRRSRV